MNFGLRELADRLLQELGTGFFNDRGSPILSVSGGVDSMVLLHLASILLEKNLWENPPLVFHLNHNLREEASGDMEMVREESERLGLPFVSESKDVQKIARRLCGNLEATGRLLRYRSLADLQTEDRGFAMTAHHADDFVENVILRLIRGGDEKSLKGISREVQLHRILVRRPLLQIRKTNLYRLAKEEKIPYREDLSNQDPVFLRNRIRSRVLPELYASGLHPERLVKSFDPVRDLSIPRPVDYRISAPSFISIDRSLFEGATRWDWKRLLDRAASRYGLPPLAGSVFLEILKRAGIEREQGFAFSYETKAYRIWTITGSPVYFIPANSPLNHTPVFQDLPDGWTLLEYNQQSRRVQLGPNERPGVFEDGLVTLTRKSGGGTGSRKLKEFFREQKLPPEVRRNIPLVISSDGIVRRVYLSMFDGRSDFIAPAEGLDIEG